MKSRRRGHFPKSCREGEGEWGHAERGQGTPGAETTGYHNLALPHFLLGTCTLRIGSTAILGQLLPPTLVSAKQKGGMVAPQAVSSENFHPLAQLLLGPWAWTYVRSLDNPFTQEGS